LIESQAFAYHTPNGAAEALGIGQLAIIEAVGLLVKIAEHVKRFHADIGSRNSTLQKTPKILQTVRVNLTVHILYRVVYDFMGVLTSKAAVRK
jgi:hypothetical protein